MNRQIHVDHQICSELSGRNMTLATSIAGVAELYHVRVDVIQITVKSTFDNYIHDVSLIYLLEKLSAQKI